MTTATAQGTLFNFRNVLIVLGIVIVTVSIIYFATQFIDKLSQWGRVIDLVLLTVILVALGRHFEESLPATELIEHPKWRWVRVTTALYLLALVATITGVIVFLNIDGVPRLVKVFGAMLLGLALIFVAARRAQRPP
ncbi:MAG: hypothetical protein ACT4PT_08740 [Methanobacteriota archaeon]